MRELDGYSTFAIGLRVDEDGDLRFAPGDSVIELSFTPDDEPLSLKEVCIAAVDESELAPWEASKPE